MARKGDSRAVKAMPDPTMMDDLDAIKGSPWASLRRFERCLADVPRPILSRHDPSVELSCATEHETYARHSQEVRAHAKLCKMHGFVAK